MKKILFILLIVVLIFNCSKKDTVDIETIIAEETTVKSSSQNDSPDVKLTTTKTDKVKLSSDCGDLDELVYSSEVHEITFTIKYELFKNQNHPNGYVIIHLIERVSEKPASHKLFKVSFATDPQKYIETVHQHQIFSANTEYEEQNLGFEEFRSVFRTAEAAIMVKLNGQELTEENLIEAKNRMEGREFGISL